jgi:hypothetical protein
MIHSISYAMLQDPNYTMALMVGAEQSEAMAGMIERHGKHNLEPKLMLIRSTKEGDGERAREREAIECDGVFAFESK